MISCHEISATLLFLFKHKEEIYCAVLGSVAVKKTLNVQSAIIHEDCFSP